MSPASGPWSCPTCLRSVPPRVDTCYCGTTRELAARVSQPDAPSDSGGRALWLPLAVGVGALALLVIAMREPAREAPAATPTPMVATPEPRSAAPRTTAPTPIPAASPPPAAAAPAPRELRPPPGPDPDQAPQKETAEASAVERRREQARAALEQSLAALAARRDGLKERLRAWGASCGASNSAVRPAGCVLLQEDIEGLVSEIDSGLSESERSARREWISPGDVRALLAAVELDRGGWGRLRQQAQAALR